MAAQVIVFLDLVGASEYDALTSVSVPITFQDFSLSTETIDPFEDSGGGTAYYQLRVRDDGVAPPAQYRIWTSINPLSAPPLPGPVGSWVERTVLSSWLVGTL
jgi:hypothetical protein